MVKAPSSHRRRLLSRIPHGLTIVAILIVAYINFSSHPSPRHRHGPEAPPKPKSGAPPLRRLAIPFESDDAAQSLVGIPQHTVLSSGSSSNSAPEASNSNHHDGPYLPTDYSLVDLNPYCLEVLGQDYCPQPDPGYHVYDVYSAYMDRALHSLINAVRVSPQEYMSKAYYKGTVSCSYEDNLAPLRYDSLLQQAAKQQARIISDPDCPAGEHDTCPKYCRLYPSCSYEDRIQTYAGDVSEVGENLLAGPGHIKGAVADWLESPSHCDNIMRPEFTHMGASHYYNGAGTIYKDFWITDFAVRAKAMYNNPIYSGAHLLLKNPTDGSSFVQFLATYHSYDSKVQVASVVINGQAYGLNPSLGNAYAGTFSVDLGFDSFAHDVGISRSDGCAMYYFLFTDEYGTEWRLPEKGAYATHQLNECTQNYFPEGQRGETEEGEVEPKTSITSFVRQTILPNIKFASPQKAYPRGDLPSLLPNNIQN